MVSVSVTKLGVITSPGFPGNYPSNTKCKWTLVAELDCDNVIVSFTQIILEEGYDKLSLCLRDECSEEEKVVLTGENFDIVMRYSKEEQSKPHYAMKNALN